MVNMTLSIPEELHKKMKKHPEFKWSEIARRSFEQKLEDEEFLDDLKSIAQGERDLAEGKTISHRDLAKRFGILNEL